MLSDQVIFRPNVTKELQWNMKTSMSRTCTALINTMDNQCLRKLNSELSAMQSIQETRWMFENLGSGKKQAHQEQADTKPFLWSNNNKWNL